MLKITGTRVYLTRGDSATIVVGAKFKHTKETYIPQEGDALRFALRSMAECGCDKEERVVLTKTIPIDTQTLTLEPADTEDLPLGEYWYDIEITFADGFVDTFIADAIFELGRDADHAALEEAVANESP